MRPILKLGVIEGERGELVNHRSVLKLLVNPFLRVVGLQVATLLNPLTMELGAPILGRCPVLPNLPKNLWRSWVYKLRPGERVIPIRRWY